MKFYADVNRQKRKIPLYVLYHCKGSTTSRLRYLSQEKFESKAFIGAKVYLKGKPSGSDIIASKQENNNRSEKLQIIGLTGHFPLSH